METEIPYFFSNLIHFFSFFTFTILQFSLHVSDRLVHHQENQITRAASGTVPSLTPTATHDTSTTEGTVPEAACVIKHLILLMMDQPVRNM